MTISGLQNRRSEFFDRWPVGKSLDNALRDTQNRTPLFYFADAADDDLSKCTWVLGRLGVDLEKRFGIASEVLILFTPYQDLQRRTFNALTERLRNEVARQQLETSGQVRFTPDPTLALLYAPDPRLQERVEAWNAEGAGSLVAALPMDSRAPADVRATLIASLHSVLSERDLYIGRNPVTGNEFFGREEMLRSLRAAFKDGHSVGLFGLRRSGKTSVIQEFRRRNAGQGFAVVVSDLEALASLAELPGQIAEDLSSALRELKSVDQSVWIGSQEEQRTSNFVELSSRIRKVAEKNSRYTFVFAYDEIESLVPMTRADPLLVRTFLGAIRRAAQGSANVCLLLTGVTSRFFRDSMLDSGQGVENPMLGFVDEFFLGPFNHHESANLLRKLGRGMMLVWDDDALEAVNRATGGYPFLIRDLASVARSVARTRPVTAGEELQITRGIVDEAFDLWRDQAAELWGEILRTLEVHHELMAEMASSESDVALREWLRLGKEAERAARSLEGLGLLSREEASWRRSATLLALQGLSRPKEADFAIVKAQMTQASDIRALVKMPEGSQLEFKATARLNIETGQKDDRLKRAIVKTVAAFLNTDGGTLLIGVRDDGHVIGIEGDIALFDRSEDKYERFLRDTFRSALGDVAVSAGVAIDFVRVEGKSVCRVTVSPSDEGVWCEEDNNDRFYVRNGNQTLALRGRKVSDYLMRRAGGDSGRSPD